MGRKAKETLDRGNRALWSGFHNRRFSEWDKCVFLYKGEGFIIFSLRIQKITFLPEREEGGGANTSSPLIFIQDQRGGKDNPAPTPFTAGFVSFHY